MDPRLINILQTGNIDGMYKLLEENQSILENVDQTPYIDTPLHIAVLAGQTHLALEIAILKPSFIRKLNQAGMSPMHLASAKGNVMITRGLLEIDKALVRVKGREGRTPLHEVVVTGNTDLLNEFLDACPESIRELTTRRETALHLAVINNQLGALKTLLEWVKRLNKKELLNWVDDEGHTILHRAMFTNQHELVKLLLTDKKAKAVEINAMNNNGRTALDIYEHQWEQDSSRMIKEILLRAGARKAQYISDQPKSEDWNIVSYIKFDWLKYFQFQRGRDSANDVRNALLVVAVLIATATYQAGLSPPGGVWQDDHNKTTIPILSCDQNDLLPNDSPYLPRSCQTNRSTAPSETESRAGALIMGQRRFLIFAFFNSAGFYTSLVMMFILTIGFPMRELLIFSLVSMLVTYIYSMISISGQNEAACICIILLLLTLPAIYTIATVSMMISFQFKLLEKLRRCFTRLECLGARDKKQGNRARDEKQASPQISNPLRRSPSKSPNTTDRSANV